MGRSDPKPSVVRALCLASRNVCAFPGCDTLLYDPATRVAAGEIAHIHGRKGPRFDPSLTPDEVRDYSNLLLLCQRHHKFVDDHPDEWPAERLRRTKSAHESTSSSDVFNGDSGLLLAVKRLLEQMASETAETEREFWLEAMRRESIGRCVSSWLAAGLESDLAWRLADDEQAGAPKQALLEHLEENHTTILTGEMGIGKSLLAERILQKFIDDDTGNRLPIFVDARVLGTDPIRDLIQEARTRTGAEDVLAVVDGLDEAPAEAERILREARAFAAANPGSRLVLTSRQMPYLEVMGKLTADAFVIPPLDDDAAVALITVAAERPVSVGELWSLPNPVQSAAHRPLFAMLLGLHLKDRSALRAPSSPWLLLQAMIEHALPSDISQELYRVMMRFAAELTDTGAPVPVANHAPLFTERLQLLSSRFVVKHDHVADYALNALTVWFAAESVLAGERSIQSIAEDQTRLVRWLDALRVIVVTGSEEWVSRVFSELVPVNAAAAASLAHAMLDAQQWSESGEPETARRDVGSRVMRAMADWVSGLGLRRVPLRCLLPDGRLRQLGYAYERGRLTTSWHQRSGEPVPVELGPDTFGNAAARDWPGWESRGVPDCAGWEWGVTFDSLRRQLSDVMAERELPPIGAAQVEHRWQIYQALARGSRWHRDSLHVGAIAEGIHDLERYGDFDSIRIASGELLTRAQLEEIGIACREMIEDGQTVLQPPWPGPDEGNLGPFIWSGYSTDRLASRIEGIIDAAIGTYESYVDSYLPQLAGSLALHQTLPAEFVGSLTPGPSQAFGPSLKWHWEPLAIGETSRVNISVSADETSSFSVPPSEWQRVSQLYATLRPTQIYRSSGWHDGTIRDFLGPMPVTELVYKWLSDDLGELNLLEWPFR